MPRKTGDANKIIGVTPKLYIKDDGTTYISGEEYNGLWSTNTGTTDFSVANAGGYANAGHWKFNEIEGNVAFNLRHRGTLDLSMNGMSRGKDGIGTFVQFLLEDNKQLALPSSDVFLMMGTGGGFTKASDFINFVQSDPINAHANLSSSSLFNGKIFFDMWAYFRKFNTSTETQCMLYFHNDSDADNFDRVLKFDNENNSGTPQIRFKYLNAAGSGLTSDISTEAGAALYPNGVSQDGGLHHIALVFDREIDFGTSGTGIYVDGKKMAISSSSGTKITGAQPVGTNGFIGCRINSSNATWTATQGSGSPKFDEHFTGKIYMAQMSSDATQATAARIANLHSMKFDVPRGPAKVDFSDRFEVDGPNILQDIGTLKQQMETLKGSFTVTLSSVRVKN